MTSSRVYTITSRLGGVRELLLPGGARLLSVAVHTGQVGADAVVDTVDVGAWGQERRRFLTRGKGQLAPRDSDAWLYLSTVQAACQQARFLGD